MMIRESLTKRMQILEKAQQEFGVESAWTVKGNVCVSIRKKSI